MTTATSTPYVARHGAGFGGEHDDTHRARHAGYDPVIVERRYDFPFGATEAHRLSSRVNYDRTGRPEYRLNTSPHVGLQRVHAVLAVLSSEYIAILNPLCDRCRANVADADMTDLPPTDEQLCQGCLDRMSEEADEARQTALVRALCDDAPDPYGRTAYVPAGGVRCA